MNETAVGEGIRFNRDSVAVYPVGASGDVPPPLQGVSRRTLDVGLLQAGASMKGEFVVIIGPA